MAETITPGEFISSTNKTKTQQLVESGTDETGKLTKSGKTGEQQQTAQGRGTFHPDHNRKISRLPAYMEIIRESERKKIIQKKTVTKSYGRIMQRLADITRHMAGTTLGVSALWRKKRTEENAPSNEEIIEEGKILCNEYLSHRLKRTGILTDELRETMDMTTSSEASEELRLVGEELERMYPDLYRNVYKQLNITFNNEEIVRKTYTLFAEQLCNSGLHWGKIIALFAMAGAFAVDCVRQNHPELVPKITETFGSFVALRLTDWVAQQGGWIIPEISQQNKGKSDHTWFWIFSTVGFIVVFAVTLIVTISM